LHFPIPFHLIKNFTPAANPQEHMAIGAAQERRSSHQRKKNEEKGTEEKQRDMREKGRRARNRNKIR